ncbi:MAG: hypothetical protein GY841_17965 [FCB group bacterium]|nr:hypothetical protein [FCB group bacterium]
MPATKEIQSLDESSRDAKGESDGKLLARLINWFEAAIEHDSDWQNEAYEDFKFKAGGTGQWSSEEIKRLESENRTHYTFNLCKPLVGLIMGVNAQNRVTMDPQPVEKQDQFLCDVLNEAARFVDERTSADTEEDEAFEDSTTCGRGFLQIDIEADPRRPTEIRIVESALNVQNVHMDPLGTRDDLGDHRYIFHEKWYSKEDFKVRYPKYAKEVESLLRTGTIAATRPHSENPSDIFEAANWSDTEDYEREISTTFYDRAKELIRVIRCEYWKAFERYYYINPQTDQPEEFDPKHLQEVQMFYQAVYNEEFQFTKVWDKKVKWCHFVGHRIILNGDNPIPYRGFSIVPVFAYKDKSDGVTHYGVIRDVKDPQREVNRRWNQTLHLLMHQEQGLAAEVDAFLNKKQAEKTWNDPTKITWLRKGALAQGKIKEKPGVIVSNGLMMLEERGQDIMKKISGINPDLLGDDRGRQEPGVVIRLRQQQGMTLLEKLFKNFHTSRKEMYKRKLAIIMQYMPDPQLMRILGSTDTYEIQDGIIINKKTGHQAELRDVRNLEYNTSVQEAKGNMSKQMFELNIFMEMMKTGMPVDPKAVIEKLNLSATEKANWIEYVEGKEQQSSMVGQLEQQIQQMELQIKSMKIQTNAEIDKQRLAQEAQRDQTESQLRLADIGRKAEKDDKDFVAKISDLNRKDQELLIELAERMAAENPQRLDDLLPGRIAK